MSGMWHPSVLDGERGTTMAPWFVVMKAALLLPPRKLQCSGQAVYVSNLNPIFYPDLNISMFELPAYLLCYAYGCQFP